MVHKEEYLYTRYEYLQRVQKDKNIHAVRTPKNVRFVTQFSGTHR